MTLNAPPAGTDGTLKPSGGSEAREATSGGFAPTSDLIRLIALVRAEPEVRADVVSDVLARANAGELSTRQAATETAAAMLDSQ